MSLPPELRVLCFRLSSTSPADLPRLTPVLLNNVLRCQIPLSSPVGKTDGSASSVLVHKLKTQLSTLLNGKSLEGRFTAVALIKAVVEIGGWEILQGSEPWVRGLLSILGKPDHDATKELVIIALTKIYCMTHPYQTLVREITTPTLPTFITSCLNLISSKSSNKSSDVSPSLVEVVFRSFAMLLPRHTTIFRPFISQIRLAARCYLAPTTSDGLFVSSSLKESARRLVVIVHQTAAKNTSGEEWAKSLRELIKVTQGTADLVFRAVLEDWESTAGYTPEAINVNEVLHGGGEAPEALPSWNGIFDGVERLTGLIEMIAEYLKEATSAPVAVPVGAILDLTTRMLSIAIPASESATGSSARLHPAVDRDERDGLWSGMPQIYIAALQVIETIADRLEENFLPVAQGALDQLAWVFPYGKHDPEFRLRAYTVAAKILPYIGQSLQRPQVAKLYTIVRACCQDLHDDQIQFNTVTVDKKANTSASSNLNADSFLRITTTGSVGLQVSDTPLTGAAGTLLPLLLSHLPQQYVDVALRSMVERVAILSHNKPAMLASILNPFVGKNGKAMTSILPHLTREFGHDDTVEILLRPRMPLLPSMTMRMPQNDAVNEESEDEDMLIDQEPASMGEEHIFANAPVTQENLQTNKPGFGTALTSNAIESSHTEPSGFGTYKAPLSIPTIEDTMMVEAIQEPNLAASQKSFAAPEKKLEEDSSDDESVHLTMQLDSDSESDG